MGYTVLTPVIQRLEYIKADLSEMLRSDRVRGQMTDLHSRELHFTRSWNEHTYCVLFQYPLLG